MAAPRATSRKTTTGKQALATTPKKLLARMKQKDKQKRKEDRALEVAGRKLMKETDLERPPRAILARQAREQKRFAKCMTAKKLPMRPLFHWEQSEEVVVPSYIHGGREQGHGGVDKLATDRAHAYAGSFELVGPQAHTFNKSVFLIGGLVYVTGHGGPIHLTVTSTADISYDSIGAVSALPGSWGEVRLRSSLNAQDGVSGGSYFSEGYDLVHGHSPIGFVGMWFPEDPNPHAYHKLDFGLDIPEGKTRWVDLYYGLFVEATRHNIGWCTAGAVLDCVVDPFVVKIRRLVRGKPKVAGVYYVGPKEKSSGGF